MLFVAIALTSSLISGVFGFGTALILLAAGSYVLPVKETIALATVMFAASTLAKSLLFRRHIDWRLAAVMSLASLPFAVLGAQVLAIAPAELLRRLLGVMVLGYVALALSGRQPRLRLGTLGIAGASGAYGFVSGLLGSGNVIKAVLFHGIGLRKEAFVGAMAATSVLANLAKLGSYSVDGFLTADHWPVVLALSVGAVGAAWIGRRLLQHLSLRHFEQGLLIVLAAVALGLLL